MTRDETKQGQQELKRCPKCKRAWTDDPNALIGCGGDCNVGEQEVSGSSAPMSREMFDARQVFLDALFELARLYDFTTRQAAGVIAAADRLAEAAKQDALVGTDGALLAACKAALAGEDRGWTLKPETADALRAAISKAEGR